MHILKFGGSSLANPARIRQVATILLHAPRRRRIVAVVSAFQGVTNKLLEMAALAASGDPQYITRFTELSDLHVSVLSELHVGRPPAREARAVRDMLEELRDAVHGIALLRHASPQSLDLTASFGERLSARIVSSYIRRRHPSVPVDARELLVTDDQFTRASVQFEKSNPAIATSFGRLFRAKPGVIPVVTGFIGSTEDGRTTTIGRNGSDYSAAIFGAALDASVIEIWTDVDGILSADPRSVGSAFVVSHMSYEEAMELSYFGAKVLHAATIAPAVRKRIPIVIKNTLRPDARGTRITHTVSELEGVAKGITSIDDCTLLTLRGMRMVGVPGGAERLFRALAAAGVNVILISQASSEHTICFAVSSSDANAAKKAVGREFALELKGGLTSLDERPRQSIVALVGDGMKGTPGVSGKVFQSLGRNRINVSAIAQGASERNISCVIDTDQCLTALNVIHEEFFEKKKRLSIVLAGIGGVGSSFLRQLQQQSSILRSRGCDVRVIAIADSKQLLLDSEGIDLGNWKSAHAASPLRTDTRGLLKAVSSIPFTNAVLIDCTASAALVDRYKDALRMGLHIITPNKRANVLPWNRYTELMECVKTRGLYFLDTTNVGAGLPIISTLNDLVSSGDHVTKIEGIFSGTLSYLFNQYDGSRSFSAVVKEAQELQLTEPDPRDDLSGEDVARKLLILARKLGLRMERRNVKRENLVPPPLRGGKFTSRFYRQYEESDERMRNRLGRATKNGAVLRYVGILRGRAASTGIREIPSDHPFAGTKGSDNVIAFTTHRYARTPLVIQGPGAGADVTAMGVFSDVLRLLSYLQ